MLASAVPLYYVFCTSEGCKSNRTTKYAILFYSILFYSILFYSILFYSILFCILSLIEAIAVKSGAF